MTDSFSKFKCRTTNNGVMQLVENPGDHHNSGGANRRKVLVHLPTAQVVTSYSGLEEILRELGWERYYIGDPDHLQFHKLASNDLISLPWQFSRFTTVHMYDIVVKNPNVFRVRDN